MKKQYTNGRQAFWDYVEQKCIELNYTLEITSTKTVISGSCKCSGYCDYNSKELVIAGKRSDEDVIMVTAHELCHAFQGSIECEEYLQAKNATNLADAGTIVDMWLSHDIELSWKQTEKYVSMLQALEYDCERRSINLLNSFDLRIDMDKYHRWANAYVFFYSLIKRDRQWFRQCSDAESKAIYALAPNQLLPSLSDYAIKNFPALEQEWMKRYVSANNNAQSN